MDVKKPHKLSGAESALLIVFEALERILRFAIVVCQLAMPLPRTFKVCNVGLAYF